MEKEKRKCLKEVYKLFYKKLSEAMSKQTKKTVWHKKDGTVETQILSNTGRLPGSRTIRDIFNKTIRELEEKYAK